MSWISLVSQPKLCFLTPYKTSYKKFFSKELLIKLVSPLSFLFIGLRICWK